MTTQIYHVDVCIIGDGAVGKTAALGFSQAGLRVLLIGESIKSQISQPHRAFNHWDVRVFALNQVAHDLLDSLKVWNALDAKRVAPVDAMHVFDADEGGSQAAKIHFDAYSAHTDTLAWIVEDQNLNQGLDSAMQFASHITHLKGRASSFKTTVDETEVILETGERIYSPLVVGADGAQSWLRGQCDVNFDYRDYHQKGIVTNFYCEKSHQGIAHQWFVGDQGIIALLPLPNNMVSLVWSAPDALASEILSESLSELALRLSVFANDVLGELSPVLPELVNSFPLRFIRPHCMISHRVVFIGDAAHVIHPLAGHGMNLGFADVQSLLACVTEYVSERESNKACGDERVLRRYQRIRKEEVALMQFSTDSLERLFSSNLTPVRAVRKLGLTVLNQFPFLKRKLITHALGK
jgi:2-octaprenylphenol hydroxylase